MRKVTVIGKSNRMQNHKILNTKAVKCDNESKEIREAQVVQRTIRKYVLKYVAERSEHGAGVECGKFTNITTIIIVTITTYQHLRGY